ncbi:MAG: hypothetical protein KAH04_07920, partial [Psychrilyobacter sp.]|nr:hypothetical protein [Psychrilyobacter sp.]
NLAINITAETANASTLRSVNNEQAKIDYTINHGVSNTNVNLDEDGKYNGKIEITLGDATDIESGYYTGSFILNVDYN